MHRQRLESGTELTRLQSDVGWTEVISPVSSFLCVKQQVRNMIARRTELGFQL